MSHKKTPIKLEPESGNMRMFVDAEYDFKEKKWIFGRKNREKISIPVPNHKWWQIEDYLPFYSELESHPDGFRIDFRLLPRPDG